MTFLLLEKLPTILYIYNVTQLLLASGDNHFNLTIQQQLLTYKCLHTKYISTGGLVCRWACKLRSVIFENIFIHQPLPRFSCVVVLDVGSCYLNSQSNLTFIILPMHLNFWVIGYLNSPLPWTKSRFKFPFLGLFQVIKFPHLEF